MIYSLTSLLRFTYFLFRCRTNDGKLHARAPESHGNWRSSLLSPGQLLFRQNALVAEVDTLSNLSAEVGQVADDAWQVGRDMLCLTLIRVELWHVMNPRRIIERDVKVLLGALVL